MIFNYFPLDTQVSTRIILEDTHTFFAVVLTGSNTTSAPVSYHSRYIHPPDISHSLSPICVAGRALPKLASGEVCDVATSNDNRNSLVFFAHSYSLFMHSHCTNAYKYVHASVTFVGLCHQQIWVTRGGSMPKHTIYVHGNLCKSLIKLTF